MLRFDLSLSACGLSMQASGSDDADSVNKFRHVSRVPWKEHKDHIFAIFTRVSMDIGLFQSERRFPG